MYITFRSYELSYKTRMARLSIMIDFMIFYTFDNYDKSRIGDFLLLAIQNGIFHNAFFHLQLFVMLPCPKSYVTLSKIHSRNFDIRVHTPGKFGSAQPMPQLIIPPRNQRPLFPLTTRGPPESP